MSRARSISPVVLPGRPRHPGRRRAVLGLIMVGAALSALSGPSAAARPLAASVDTPAGRFAISLPIFVADQELGLVEAELDGTDSVFLDRRQLADLLGARLSPDVRTGLLGNGVANPTIGLADLSAIGITARFDPAALRVDIAVALDKQGATPLSVIDDSAASVGRDFLAPSDVSASLTLIGSQAIEWRGPESGAGPVALLAQFAANAGGLDGVSFFADFAREARAGSRLRRGNLLLVHDDVARAIRFSLGDTPVIGTGFQTTPVVAGLSVGRSYSELQPFRNIRPGGQFRFRIERPALVDIRVNGVSIRQMRLDPGQYDIGDFPFLTGQNNVEIYTFDDFNQSLIARFSQFFSGALLRPGLTEFGFSVGVPQLRNRVGAVRYADDEALATGYVRHGFFDVLTLGVNGQANRFGWLAGVEAGWASPIGSFFANVALSSNQRTGTGGQALLGYDLNVLDLGPIRNLRANAEVRLISTDFRLVGPALSSLAENPYRREYRGALSASIPGGIFASVNGAYLQRRDRIGDEYRVGVAMSKNVGGFNVNATLETARIAGLGRDTRLVITLLRTLGERATVRSSYDSQQNALQLQYSRFEAPEVNDYGVDLLLERADGRWAGTASGRFNAARFQAAVRNDIVRTTGAGGSSTQRTTYSVATQLAFDGRRVAIGRPVGPSFAIVAPHPSLEGREVRVGQGFGRRRPQAISGALGPALAPVGSPYAPQILNVDVENLPIGYDLGKARYDLLPGAATAYSITVGSSASRIVIGRLVDAAGAAIGLQVGKLSAIDAAAAPPVTFFTDRNGRFTIEGVRPGRYMATLGTGGAYRFPVTVGDDSIGLLDLGAVVAKEGGSQ